VSAWCGTRRADLGRTLRGVAEGCAANLKALSGGKYDQALFDAEGGLQVRAGMATPVPFESLTSLEKDAAWLALRLTLFQVESKGKGRLVVLLDDPFDFEEARLALVSRAFKALGKEAQVLHLTSRPAHRKLADQPLEI
jgi:uncharacterized protein YhaN